MTYLIATGADQPSPHLFDLHRFHNVEITNQAVKRPEDFDLNDFIATGGFGFGGGNRVKLVLLVDPKVAEHLTETPLADDQGFDEARELDQAEGQCYQHASTIVVDSGFRGSGRSAGAGAAPSRNRADVQAHEPKIFAHLSPDRETRLRHHLSHVRAKMPQRIELGVKVRKKRAIAASVPDISANPEDSQLDIRLWLLRFLVPLGGYLTWLDDHGFRSDRMARAIGFDHWLDDRSFEYDQKVAMAELRDAHAAAEALAAPVMIPDPLPFNAARLAALLGLSAVEIEILQFLILLQHEPLLEESADNIGLIGGNRAYHVIAIVLGLSENAVKAALVGGSRLIVSGLVRPNYCGLMGLSSKFDLIGGGFAERMMMPLEDPVSIFKYQFVLAPPPRLSLADYDHVRPMLDILIPHLRRAHAEGCAGVNAFIYGPPGTGKSQLCRVIAELLGVSLFEVSSEDQDGDPIGGEKRLRAFSAAQSVLMCKSAILAFDESEDVFGYADTFADKRGDAQLRKGWVNRALEQKQSSLYLDFECCKQC